MRILYLALKDLSQVLGDKKSLLFLVAMPIAFTFFMGLAYQGAVAAPDPRLPVGWANQDPDGALSQALHDLLAASGAIRLVELAPEQVPGVQARIASGELAAALVVPPDFSALVQAGQPAQLALLGDELSTAGQSAFQLVRVPVTRLMSAAEIARLIVERAEALKPFPGPPERNAEWSLAFSQAVESWQRAAAHGPQVRVEKAGDQVPGGLPLAGNPYNQASPGILVQFAIFGLVTSATVVVQERQAHTMQRLLTTAIRRWEIVAGHLLAMFALVMMQQVLLVAFGQLALGVGYLRAPAAVLLIMVGLGLWVSSMGLLIGVIAKGDEQVVLFSLIAMFLFASLGGAWFPLEGTGATYAAIGRVTPAAWAMEGFQDVLIRGLGLEAVLLPAGILLAYALGFFGLAAWRFRTE